MKTLFLVREDLYDGTQLRPLFAYMEHGLLGDSAVAWVGPCEVSFAHMIDGEDLRERAEIRGDRMVHFIVEMFDRDLYSGVALQRLLASMVRDSIEAAVKTPVSGERLRRDGDDLYLGSRKLSISIATRSAVSVMVHFAVNIRNAGTPVPTCALEDDFGLAPELFAKDVLHRLATEHESMLAATRKVRPI